MRFILGLLLGFAVGFGGALLFARQRRAGEGETWEVPESPISAPPSENHDSLAGLRRAMRSVQDQVQVAWEEAREAAREAEQELRTSYERKAHRQGGAKKK